jgi:site-specific DNA-methyltransferase (adenine-specific)
MKAPRIIHADCLDALRAMDACSVDAIVTDPPAGIAFMNKDWDRDKGGRTEWVAWMAEIARECLRVIKPGGHALVWALPRTSHWTGWAWEDAGWQPRDKVVHLFGSGFPKSLDVSKAIDKAAGAKRTEKIAPKPGHENFVGRDNLKSLRESGALSGEGGFSRPWMYDTEKVESSHWNFAPVTDDAKQWSGWGSALKPAAEDWWLMRKPLDGTIAANVLAHGTGAINVNGCRIGTDGEDMGNPSRFLKSDAKLHEGWQRPHKANEEKMKERALDRFEKTTSLGRWPANVTLDEEAAAMLDEQTEIARPKTGRVGQRGGKGFGMFDDEKSAAAIGTWPADPGGGASRFFYVAKPSRAERDAGCAELEPQQRDEGRVAGAPGGDNPRNRGAAARTNSHPTVKSIALMRWLVRLITPPGGVVLDPFCGSGTTMLACIEEGVDAIGIEREAEYVEIIRRRVAHALKTPAKPTKRKPRAVAPVAPQPAPVAPTMNDMASRQLGLFDGV